MSIDQITGLLVTITLVEMMVTVGLVVKLNQLTPVVQQWHLLARAILANYVVPPALVLGPSLVFQVPPLITVGLLLAAVCPGGPYGAPFTGLAKGNVPIAVGLGVILAGSSAILAPLLLGVLVPIAAGDQALRTNSLQILETLLLTVLVPLAIGMVVRARRPALADRLKRPASWVSALLNLIMVGSITVIHFHELTSFSAIGVAGMVVLSIANLAVGWLVGGPGSDNRTTVGFTTATRNMGTSLVIAMASFPRSAALAAALAFAVIQTLAIGLVAVGWGRLGARPVQSPGRRSDPGTA